MMKEKMTFKLPPQSLVYMLVCAAGIIAAISLAILPRQRQMADIDREITRIRTRIEEQKILVPLFRNLEGKTCLQAPQGLPFPEKARLSRAQIDQLPEIFRRIAIENRLRLDEVKPDFNSLKEDSGRWRIHLAVSGDFFDFRNFLVRLGELPYLETVEQITIRSLPKTETLELGLKLCLAQEE